MKYVRQFLIIMLFSFIGEGLNYIIPFPIPASIYGLVLLFVSLMTGVIKLDDVRDVGRFLIEIMPIMFVPAGVGLMTSWNVLKPELIPVIVIMIVSTILVMGIAGKMTEFVIRRNK